MIQSIRVMLVVALLNTLHGGAFATDRFFSDITAESPSKQYRVEAKSPDNSSERGRKAFQSGFVYRCWDGTTKTLLWTRKQPMTESKVPDGKTTRTYMSPDEASPIDVYVSDTGWTMIRTCWDELVAVDKTGRDRCRISLLSEAFTKDERKKYVHDTTAGPMWSGYSLWYFLEANSQPMFVVRPWWGRRVIVSLGAGKLAEETADLSAAALAHEQAYVLDQLSKGVKTRKEWEKGDCCDAVWPILDAAYLAGRIQVAEAIPLLESLQDSPYGGSSTMGGMGFGERFDGEVNPHNYSTLRLRQVTHLSLRRLGRMPGPWPANVFDVQYDDYAKHHPYAAKALAAPRHSTADKVKKGMKAEQVLDLLGGPDFVGYDTWEYDLDSDPPSSLSVKWDVRHVINVQRTTPALWKQGFVRDEQIVQ